MDSGAAVIALGCRMCPMQLSYGRPSSILPRTRNEGYVLCIWALRLFFGFIVVGGIHNALM